MIKLLFLLPLLVHGAKVLIECRIGRRELQRIALEYQKRHWYMLALTLGFSAAVVLLNIGASVHAPLSDEMIGFSGVFAAATFGIGGLHERGAYQYIASRLPERRKWLMARFVVQMLALVCLLALIITLVHQRTFL